MSVSVISYGLGNLGSVSNMLRRVGVDAQFVNDSAGLLRSERLLLPGIGSFDTGVRLLEEGGLVGAIADFVASGRPLLGICLGMQLLLDSSEEGELGGLGLIPGRSVRLRAEAGIRVPHMGWNAVRATRADPLLSGLPPESRFYFVHSYKVVPARESDVLGVTSYGETFASVIRRDNVMGAQFHPEKSHDFGKHILRNFANL